MLSLLAERPMHGYEVNLELERRDVRDWAGISRPQVYYSIKKLERMGLIRAAGEAGSSAGGPERRVFSTTESGLADLASSLERTEWARQRPPPPFLTWLALSWKARPGVVSTMVAERRRFLAEELSRERETLADIRRELGTDAAAAVLMVELTIRQFELELTWLDTVLERLG